MRIFYALTILLLASHSVALSQPVTIRGQVRTPDSALLAGVSITVKGSATAYITDDKGAFVISGLKLPAVLRFSFVGHKTQTYTLKKADTTKFIAITLAPISTGLAEVVVVGYGTSRKKDVAGSVVILSGVGSAPPAKAMEGKVAGIATTDFASAHKGARAKQAMPGAKPASNPHTIGNKAVAHSKILTAGELSDFKKWKLWNNYSGEDFKVWSRHWKLSPVNRYCVQVQNKDHKGIVGERVYLINTGTHDTVWRAVTDNTGKAELWANFNMDDEGQHTFTIVCRNETIRYPTTFENGINRITLKTSCAHSNIANIAFVVDATGSMGDEIKYLQDELNDVIDKTSAKNKDLKLHISSVFYRDRSDEYVTRHIDFQSEPAPLMQFINQQSAGGGGDYPEAVEDALTTALDSLHWDRDARAKIIFLILDAPPHDAAKEKMQNLMRQAAAMGVRIVPIVCSGIDKSTEYLMRSLALATNGSYVFLTDDSGVGEKHIKPTTDDYKVELLNDLLQRVMAEMVYMEPCNEAEKPDVPVTSNNNAKVNVYPNPSAGHIQIKCTDTIKELYITDFTGKILERINASPKTQLWQADLSSYPSGTYLVRYFTEQKGWGAEKVLLIK